jgi:hypothetical protein
VESDHAVWVSYLLGAGLTLFYKWARYVWVGCSKKRKTIARASAEWFFEDTVSNSLSWITTVGAVWVFGAAYINRVVWLFGSWPQGIPVDLSIAFFLGSLLEILAPAAVKWVVAQIPVLNVNGGA